jgi:addiction module RelE/StbE family toxin
VRIEWTESAVVDLAQLRDYIAKDSPHYARRFTERIVAAVERLVEHPRSGRRVPEAQRPDVRELIFRGYRIIYRLIPDGVQVLTIVHGRRDLTRRAAKPWEVD